MAQGLSCVNTHSHPCFVAYCKSNVLEVWEDCAHPERSSGKVQASDRKPQGPSGEPSARIALLLQALPPITEGVHAILRLRHEQQTSGGPEHSPYLEWQLLHALMLPSMHMYSLRACWQEGTTCPSGR
eukprot:scaffold57416_cov21-Tisochrysis_lutea.AAC.1